MPRHKYVFGALGAAAAGFLIAGMFAAPTASVAMPTFAQAYGVACSTCHTQVPLLNAYGRYVQRTGYASLDRTVLSKALPVWIDASANYDSSNASGTPNSAGVYVAKTSFGNLAVHGVGYLAPDITFHAQQWITQGDDSGGVDTLWVTYNNIFHREGHLFVGKILNPAPSPYGQDFQIDGATASSTLVGEHDWGATYGNRWGSRLAYVHKALDVEAGYYLSSDDLNGITDFNPGDKTFQWKVAYARPTVPVEFGVFGSKGSLPVSTGTDVYRSIAGYLQIDPSRYGRPGLFAVYQGGRDGNPGTDPNTGNALSAASSRGASVEIFEHVLRGSATVGFRHDFNDDGLGTVSNGNAVNLAFNVPHFSYAHVFLEANTGANSALPGAGVSSGPTFKGWLWLTLPIEAVH
jgi:hypothetical protein